MVGQIPEEVRQMVEQHAIENAGIVVYKISKESMREVLFYCNETFAEMLGYSPEDLVKVEDFRQLKATKRSLADYVVEFEHLLEGDVLSVCETWCSKPGRAQYSENTLIPLHAEQGKFVVALCRFPYPETSSRVLAEA